MSHKVLINGTAYAVAGGDTLVSGTKYQPGGGKTLVNGAAYDISFAPATVEITITKDGAIAGTEAYVQYNGRKYESGTITISASDSVLVYVKTKIYNSLYVNDAFITSDKEVSYTYAPTAGVASATIKFEITNGKGYWVYINEN